MYSAILFHFLSVELCFPVKGNGEYPGHCSMSVKFVCLLYTCLVQMYMFLYTNKIFNLAAQGEGST